MGSGRVAASAPVRFDAPGAVAPGRCPPGTCDVEQEVGGKERAVDEFVEAVVSEVEYEQTAWVAALDIAKASAMVCTRLPVGSGSGRKAQRVWQVGASTSAVLELAGHLVCQGVELVVMESASVYWRPVACVSGWSTLGM